MLTRTTWNVLILAASEVLGVGFTFRLGAAAQSPDKVSGEAARAAHAEPPAALVEETPRATLFKNVKVFDGKSQKLTVSTSVLVVGNKIAKVGNDIASPERTTIIDGN